MDIILNLGDENKIALEKFREIFKNEASLQEKSNYLYLRWLIAHNFDLPQAEKMLRNSLAWRKENRIDHIFEEFHRNEMVWKYMPLGVVARENSGNPILLWRGGLMDLRGIYESILPGDDLKAILQILETYYTLKADSDLRFTQITVIFDMKDFGLRHVTVNSAMKLFIELCKTYEANYPEVLGKLFIINTPKICEMVFALVKPLLNERTISKIHIYGQDATIWKEALVVSIPADCLPVSYGGTKTDPIDGNPDCSSLVSMGGEIPTSCYLVNNQTNLIDSNTEGFLLVKNRTKQFLAIKIGNPNTLLKWEFHSEDGDIEFSVTGKRGQYEEIVVPTSRVDCHIAKIRGQTFCDDYKLFILEFDNSFSYFRSKKIWYKINLESLKDEAPGQFSCETYATI